MRPNISKLFIALFIGVIGANLIGCNGGSATNTTPADNAVGKSTVGDSGGVLGLRSVSEDCTSTSCKPGTYLIDNANDLRTLSTTLVSQQQQSDQWSNNHYAVLVKPGTYNVTGPDGKPYAFNLGYYTQIIGVGKTMDDVTLNPGVEVYNQGGFLKGSPTCVVNGSNPLCETLGGLNNFWRGIENFSMDYSNLGNVLIYAVSQAAPIRSIHFKGGSQALLLCDYKPFSSCSVCNSGGVMANSTVDGNLAPGSQQQWLTFGSQIKGKAENAIWNSVSVGTQYGQPLTPGSNDKYRMPADNAWTNFPISEVNSVTTPYRGKPYLSCGDTTNCNLSADKIAWQVLVPQLRQNFSGVDSTPPTAIDVNSQFFVLSPTTGTTDANNITTLNASAINTINSALASGKNLLITPGVYNLDGGSINITNPNTIVLGLGLPSLTCTSGQSCINVSAEQGVEISGITLDAGYQLTQNLLQIGTAKNNNDNSANPIFLHDVYFRIAETQLNARVAGQERQTTVALTINANNVVGDNLWVWRADHDKASSHNMTDPEANLVTWGQDRAQYGVIIYGDNVTMFGLAVEHFQNYQTVWAGNNGNLYFYQSEMPYDVPSIEAWTCSYPGGSTSQNGCASYLVESQVTSHNATGVGVYTYFANTPINAPSAILAPTTANITHMIGKWLNGNESSGYYNLVTNPTGDTCWGYGAAYGIDAELANQISVLGAFNATASKLACGGPAATPTPTPY